MIVRKEQFTIRNKYENQIISASVGIVSPKGKNNLYVAIRSQRGWDIPGGHVEEGETPIQGFRRELREEAKCILLTGASVVAVLESKLNPRAGIIVYRGFCRVERFVPTEEIFDRKLFHQCDLLKMYYGDKPTLEKLLTLYKQRLS